jgi:hypothetical protein
MRFASKRAPSSTPIRRSCIVGFPPSKWTFPEMWRATHASKTDARSKALTARVCSGEWAGQKAENGRYDCSRAQWRGGSARFEVEEREGEKEELSSLLTISLSGSSHSVSRGWPTLSSASQSTLHLFHPGRKAKLLAVVLVLRCCPSPSSKMTLMVSRRTGWNTSSWSGKCWALL